jgi:dihydroorotate dehydrogenase (fumarate)
MADLSTTYMGIELKNPVMVAACTLSNKVDNIKRAEAAGAGGLVIRSLFEEQIRHEVGDFDDALHLGGDANAEATSFFPTIAHGEAKEHLFWVERTREATEMPLFASLNAVTPGKWVSYAKQLADTGVNGLEFNYYSVEADIDRSAADVEARLLETFEAVRGAVDIPIAVKLSPYYTSVGNVVKELEARGANAVVLFNRFLQPDIDPDKEEIMNEVSYSSALEMKVPLRWLALLYGRVMLDLSGNTGVMEARDVVKFILAGATTVQVASCLFRNGVDHLTTLVSGLDDWMNTKGYATIEDFRGKLSQRGFEGDTVLYERAQYLDFLMSRQRWVKP